LNLALVDETDVESSHCVLAIPGNKEGQTQRTGAMIFVDDKGMDAGVSTDVAGIDGRISENWNGLGPGPAGVVACVAPRRDRMERRMYERFEEVGAAMPNFEVFNRRASPRSTEPLVTIQKRGTMSFNRAAFEAIGEPEAVELLFDRDERVVGFRPVGADVPHAYRPRKQGNAYNYIIAGQAFTQYYGIDTGTARRYPAAMFDGVLAVDLKQAGTDATGPRGRDDGPRPTREGGLRGE